MAGVPSDRLITRVAYVATHVSPMSRLMTVAPAVGFEPTTKRLTVARSTTELRRSEAPAAVGRGAVGGRGRAGRKDSTASSRARRPRRRRAIDARGPRPGRAPMRYSGREPDLGRRPRRPPRRPGPAHRRRALVARGPGGRPRGLRGGAPAGRRLRRPRHRPDGARRARAVIRSPTRRRSSAALAALGIGRRAPRRRLRRRRRDGRGSPVVDARRPRPSAGRRPRRRDRRLARGRAAADRRRPGSAPAAAWTGLPRGVAPHDRPRGARARASGR